MKIVRDFIPSMGFEEFADKYNLTFTITERRSPRGGLRKYFGSFDGCEVKDGRTLIGAHGNGGTLAEVINDYIKQIEHRTLVVHAMSKDRREIDVPTLLKFDDSND